MKRRVLILLFGLCLLLSACARDDAPMLLQPAQDGSVTDAAALLSPAAEQRINEKSTALERACGAQIRVATVDFIRDLSVQSFADTVFSQWGLPKNGALLLIVAGQDEAALAVGPDLTQIYTAEEKDRLLADSFWPTYTLTRYDEAAENTVGSVYARLCEAYSLDPAAPQPAQGGFRLSTGMIIVIIASFVVFFIKMRYRR